MQKFKDELREEEDSEDSDVVGLEVVEEEVDDMTDHAS